MENEEYNDQVEGRNAVLELLESGRDINKILVANGEKHGSIHKILAIAKERKNNCYRNGKKQAKPNCTNSK